MPQTPAHLPSDSAHDLPWSQVWHVPVLLLGLGLFIIGIWLATGDREPNQFPQALSDIAANFEANNLEKAAEGLNRLEENLNLASHQDLARYWQYRGDLAYLQLNSQLRVAVDTELSRQTNQTIANFYSRAEEEGGNIDGKSLIRYARTLVALDRETEALALVDRLKDAPAERRYAIVRSLIDRVRATGELPDLELFAQLINRFRDELRTEIAADKRRAQEIWITSVEAEVKLDAGDPQGVIDDLLLRLQRLTSQGGDADLASLTVILARAYQQVGELDRASETYLHARSKITADDLLNAQILVGLGQIALADTDEMNVHEALDHFSAADRLYPTALCHIDALIGRGDCEARLASHPESIEHFGQAVEVLVATTSRSDQRRQIITDVIRSHIDHTVDQARFDQTLDLLTLLVPLYQPHLPADLLRDFAVAHESIAQQRKAAADALPDQARQLANQEAATHYAQAAEYYLQHAHVVTIRDDQSHSLSLWKAAGCFDAAQMWKRAIDVYAEFVNTRDQDPKKLAAINHLAKAYMADSQYEPAADLFLQLVNEHPHSPETYDSLVPLARCYIALGKFDAAERGLQQVVDNHPAITPENAEYQAALIELGKLFYRLGENDGTYYPRAIERLEFAVASYGRTDHGPTLRYLLADAYRKSIAQLERNLAQRQSENERLALQAERTRRLEQAQHYYNQVVNELEALPAESLSPAESLYYRNAYFYRADCAFDRRQFEAAIELYDAAARRWESDPASLVALVQIVNAYCELGQYQEARGANDRALWQLQRIPDDKFTDPTLPMTRRHWEDWLRWTNELNLYATQARAVTSADAPP
jgi:tetratricopeptide (TPR) repeat protein